jgi:DNA polymerase-1
MMNLACISIAKEFKARSINAKIVAQIHDELIAHCAEADKTVVAEIIKRNMETAAPCSVPMVAIPSFGTNFREAKGD